MKMPCAHFQMVRKKCANFKKNPCTHLLEHAWTKSCPQTGDRERDGQTDRRTGWNQYTPQTSFAWGINKDMIVLVHIICDKMTTSTCYTSPTFLPWFCYYIDHTNIAISFHAYGSKYVSKISLHQSKQHVLFLMWTLHTFCLNRW